MANIKMTDGDLAKYKNGDLALVVIEIPPVDPGDAHGIGTTQRRPIRPDLLHETAEEAEARWLAWQSAGVR